MDRKIKRGDLYYANLDEVIGSEQGGIRPILVIQNNVGNKYSPTIVIAPITTKTGKPQLPTHIKIDCYANVLPKDSVVLLEQIRTVDKQRFGNYLGHVDGRIMRMVDDGIKISLGIR